MLKDKLILASQSPRRAEILTSVGWPFEAIPADIDESRFESEDALRYVLRLAQTKAETVAARVTSGRVLGADTVVVVDQEILGQRVANIISTSNDARAFRRPDERGNRVVRFHRRA
jgi:predicted house-cleaning NTP pyrophosphatase (Maf/HAM1 superfamily)